MVLYIEAFIYVYICRPIYDIYMCVCIYVCIYMMHISSIHRVYPMWQKMPFFNAILMHSMALERMNLAYKNVLVKLFVIAHISVSVFGWVLGCVVFGVGSAHL